MTMSRAMYGKLASVSPVARRVELHIIVLSMEKTFSHGPRTGE